MDTKPRKRNKKTDFQKKKDAAEAIECARNLLEGVIDTLVDAGTIDHITSVES